LKTITQLQVLYRSRDENTHIKSNCEMEQDCDKQVFSSYLLASCAATEHVAPVRQPEKW